MIDYPQIVLEKTDALCTHDLSSLLHYVIALEEGVDPVKLGLSKPDDKENAYIQCLDLGKPCTRGGTAIFKVRRIKCENSRKEGS